MKTCYDHPERVKGFFAYNDDLDACPSPTHSVKARALRIMEEDPETALNVQVEIMKMVVDFLSIGKKMLAVLEKVEFSFKDVNGTPMCPLCFSVMVGVKQHNDDCDFAVIEEGQAVLR